ncbi:PorT family protein [Brumimicrobium salinarum]|uniref:PorT family protein n=1 Tax=Brumimicrobium salinarum TaxID=2058658 RepID=A0A2I0QZ62_9FLAO|nr:porin family protein [Brumimicrobium salinarum]PKR79631.1 PorT family protein [Brumimicrobium salinarum]
MKKVLLFTALLTTTFFATAQDARGDLKLGIKGGATLSNVYDSEGEEFDADARLGYTAGLNLEIPIGTYLGIHPEVLVTQKGFKGSGSILGSDYSYKRTTTFLEVPVLLALKPSEFFSIVAGPQFAYLMSEKNEFDSGIGVSQEEEFENDNIRKNLLGLVGGLNLNFNHVTVGVRLGIDLQKNHGDGSADTPRYKNAWGQFTIGYRFF